LAWVNRVLARKTSKLQKASKANQLHTVTVGQGILEDSHQGIDEGSGWALLCWVRAATASINWVLFMAMGKSHRLKERGYKNCD
jgi:hypothetical protein